MCSTFVVACQTDDEILRSYYVGHVIHSFLNPSFASDYCLIKHNSKIERIRKEK